jgi:hypothetical protein
MENHIRKNLPNEVHIVEMHPLLYPTILKTFNLFKIFEAQPIIGKKSESTNIKISDDWTDKQFIDEIVAARQACNFSSYAHILLASLKDTGSFDLISYLKQIDKKMGKEGLENVDLIPFLIELNSGNEILFRSRDSDMPECSNPYETVFDLSLIRESQGRHEPIEEALLSACDEVNMHHRKIRVKADPRSHVPISGRDGVYISNINFVMERKDDL